MGGGVILLQIFQCLLDYIVFLCRFLLITEFNTAVRVEPGATPPTVEEKLRLETQVQGHPRATL